MVVPVIEVIELVALSLHMDVNLLFEFLHLLVLVPDDGVLVELGIRHLTGHLSLHLRIQEVIRQVHIIITGETSAGRTAHSQVIEVLGQFLLRLLLTLVLGLHLRVDRNRLDNLLGLLLGGFLNLDFSNLRFLGLVDGLQYSV